VVLFEMVCGRPPFARTDLHDVLHDHVATPPPSPRAFMPSLSPELEAVILTLLAKAPEGRFQTADELQAALAGCPEWQSSGAADPGWSTRIALIEPPPPTPVPEPPPPAPAAMLAPAPLPANVPAPLPMAADVSVANLRPRRLRNFVVVTLVLLLAGSVTVGLTYHRVVAAAPAPEPGSGVGSVREPESRLSPAGRRHLTLAQDYSRKFWCSAAIEELATGFHDDPELRADPAVTRMMIPCLRTKNQDKTLEFLVTVVGRDARRELESALTEELKPDVRDGVQHALARLPSRR
jgi:hypothetical protein